MTITKLKKGVVKRSDPVEIGIFVDGIGIDRGSRRMQKRVSWTSLIQSLCQGRAPNVCRYYTVIPFEDDARQHSFLDSVARAGLSVVVKRLPPKGIERQVTSDVEAATDIIGFALGLDELIPTGSDQLKTENSIFQENQPIEGARRKVILVAPSRDMIYPLQLLRIHKIETVIADFGPPQTGELMQVANNWIDLSTSETIWRENGA